MHGLQLEIYWLISKAVVFRRGQKDAEGAVGMKAAFVQGAEGFSRGS